MPADIVALRILPVRTVTTEANSLVDGADFCQSHAGLGTAYELRGGGAESKYPGLLLRFKFPAARLGAGRLTQPPFFRVRPHSSVGCLPRPNLNFIGCTRREILAIR